MKLRQTLAMGAVSALLAPGLAVAGASVAFADETQPSLAVAAPKVLGVGGQAVEFTADIKGLPTASDDVEQPQPKSLHFKLELENYFKGLGGRYKNHGVVLEYVNPEGDADKWTKVELGKDDNTLTGGIYGKFTKDQTVKLRLSVARPEKPETGGTRGPAGARRAAADQLDEQSEEPKGSARPGLRPCDTAVPGFTLTSELRPYTKLRLAPGATATSTSSPSPTTEPEPRVPTDVDKVKVGVPSVDLVDLEGDVVAAGAAKKFTAVLCNPTESVYDNVALGLFFGRLDDVKGAEKDLRLERLADGKWAAVDLKTVTEDDETFLSTSFVDADGKGVAMKPGDRIPSELRISAVKESTVGDWGSIGIAQLLDSAVAGGFDRAAFRVVAPGSTPAPPTPSPTPTPTPAQPAPVPDDLAHTGANVTAGVVGIGLLLAGGVAFFVARRRRQAAA
jgi:LPXTG-motif cell wall-anchored protein